MSTDLRLVEYGGPAAAAHAHTPHAPELRESRARIVRAGDEERRRLERDLHDGAQQRLLALGMALQLLRSHVTDRQGGVLLRETEGSCRRRWPTCASSLGGSIRRCSPTRGWAPR